MSWFVRAKRNKTVLNKLPAADEEEADKIVGYLKRYGWQDVEAYFENK